MASSSSSTEPARATAKPTLHWFETKKGTDVSTFESYIKTLPDRGEGVKAVFPGLRLQTYMTNLTLAQVKEVEKRDFIKFVYPVSSIDTASFGAIPPPHIIEKRINKNLNLQKRLNSEDHLKVISQKKYAGLDDYLFDPLLGRGQTIYIIDEGFNINHQELARTNDRDVQHYVVPNIYTLADEPNRAIWPPEDDISDINGHGTMGRKHRRWTKVWCGFEG
jgi:subtilisin family serine protease